MTCGIDLEDLVEAEAQSPDVSCTIVDGAFVIQMLKPGTSKTFHEYAQYVFIPYVKTQLQHVKRLDLIWDRYVTDSLKGTARAKRGKGVRRRVTGSAPIPGNWQNFLRVDENKTELFDFLSGQLISSLKDDDKEIIITDGDQVLCVPARDDVSSLVPCNHEEADTRILLHAIHASQSHKKVLVRTPDTDVAVLAIMVSQTMPVHSELWVAFGTGKRYRYLAAHKIAAALGRDKSLALAMFHALTGCDTVSAFVGHGKKTAWAAWKALPELTDALLSLACAPPYVSDECMDIIERFVIVMYDRTSTCTSVNEARKKLFARKQSPVAIPPTKAALEQHVKRAAYQGGYIWGQTQNAAPVLPSPLKWGWVKNAQGLYEPYWTTLPEAAKACYELLCCGCKKGCRSLCKCKRAGLQCTALCTCEGECS